jgi:hypothetical protein
MVDLTVAIKRLPHHASVAMTAALPLASSAAGLRMNHEAGTKQPA